MKIIIDTNILISAILKDRIPEKVLIWIIENPFMNWIASYEIMTEYKEVLKRPKFHLSQEIIEHWYSLFDKTVNLFEVSGFVDFPRDRKDAKFLICAKTTQADFLITGDGDFKDAQSLISTKIISVKNFYNEFIQEDQQK